ncbi:radical SAM protein [Streptomyces sp. ZAF1911]|uniref:radical SAM protein n=1 Tax=Streptomyces sp. ZAF1911 TaxID=2944129 RepID=UPI00237C0D2D|nr:radical SAM protein [Streptomyces sp. ZAF1911]MDD9380429.1 radical SAM protein [Streptomyces sp. ZAF1911]
MRRDVTLLWALRSRCALACAYCYFGTVEEHKVSPPNQLGVLSHIARNDLSASALMDFARTLDGSPVKRVVIAGGEPLDWPGALDLIQVIKEAGCEVVIATNGIPLTRPGVAERLVELKVDGVSVSLDSADPDTNDLRRPSRSGKTGHRDVVAGIRALLQARNARPAPRVGLYTVVMRPAPHEITDMARFGAELGVDYYVPQPISLAPDHKLFDELAHTSDDVPAVARELAQLHAEPQGLAVPDASSLLRFAAAISTQDSGRVRDCFGGARLFFAQPDGSLWDCPSDRRIAATPPERHRTISGGDARVLFADRPACTDCSLFSRDCVNMWPLVLDMPRLLTSEAAS